jgi:hypothetical protein
MCIRFRPNLFGRSFGRKFGVLYDDYVKNRVVSGCAINKKDEEVVLHTQEAWGSSPSAGGNQTLGVISARRRTDELDLYMDWSEYTTGYTTSAEYPLIGAHSRAGAYCRMNDIHIELFSPEQKVGGSNPLGRTNSFVINVFWILDGLV